MRRSRQSQKSVHGGGERENRSVREFLGFPAKRPTFPLEKGVSLVARSLSFSFGNERVLDGVDVRLEPGRIVGVIGPNGAGKTTLVRLLSRILAPESGRIELAGRSLHHWSAIELARALAVVPQNPELPTAFTAWEIVLMGRTPHLDWLGRERPQDRLRAHEAMAETGILRLADRRINQLSGGERQRVVIARALAQEPRVLLMDEPTAHLDLNHQVDILTLVADLVRERGLATLAIFHDLNLASRYCDRLILLKEGSVLTAGPPVDVLTADSIERAYGVRVTVIEHPNDRLPVVLSA